MNGIAIVSRTLLHLLALALVVRKVWPGELLSTPLAQLTLGGLLWGAIGLMLGSFLVLRTVSIPDKEKRGPGWRNAWIVTPFVIGLIVAFPFLYEQNPKHNAVMDWMYAVIAGMIGWLVS